MQAERAVAEAKALSESLLPAPSLPPPPAPAAPAAGHAILFGAIDRRRSRAAITSGADFARAPAAGDRPASRGGGGCQPHGH